ncbi:hypothetical protein BKA56DRAFT_735574 [Ilyonectria sp. MPI-CAGE-AT-0026]|nr:hypothetical protein BKA56DRAFT_735574 [Ilyonectria sp. MPI-CAGE-AT-0026]
MDMIFAGGRDQAQSPFFKMLNEDVRRLIYLELCGGRYLHIKFRRTSPWFRQQGHPAGRRPGWRHSVCPRNDTEPRHQVASVFHRWCFLSTSLLRTCKRAAEEGLPMLYGTNSLEFDSSSDLLHFKAQFEPCFKLIKHLDIILSVVRVSIEPGYSFREFDTLLHVMTGYGHRSSINLRIRMSDSIVWFHHTPITTFLKKIKGLRIKSEIFLPSDLKAVAEELRTEAEYLTFNIHSAWDFSLHHIIASDYENYSDGGFDSNESD